MFSFTRWHRLPLETRVKICSEFGLKKGSTVVFNGMQGSMVQSDGYNVVELEDMFEKLQEKYPEAKSFNDIVEAALKENDAKTKAEEVRKSQKKRGVKPKSFYEEDV